MTSNHERNIHYLPMTMRVWTYRFTTSLWFAVPLVIFAWLAWYAAPAKDDLCYALALQLGGFKNGWIHSISPTAPSYDFWQALKNNYLTWQGRYTSSSLLFPLGYLSPEQLLKSYRLIPLSLLVGTGLACFKFLSALSATQNLHWHSSIRAILTLLICGCFFVGIEAPNETLYWAAGALTYQLPLILMFLLGAQLLKLFQLASAASLNETSFSQLWPVKLSAILIFLIAGCNEIVMALQCALMGGLVCYALLKRDLALAKKLAFLCFCALIAGLIVFVSPGNALREKAMGVPPNSLVDILEKSLPWLAHKVAFWLNSGLLLSSGLIVALLLPRVPQRFIRVAGITAALALLMVWIATLPSFYENIQPYGRINTPLYAVFLTAFFALLLALQPTLKSLFNRAFAGKPTVLAQVAWMALLIGWSLSLFFNSEFKQRFNDIALADDFYYEVQQRYVKAERMTQQQQDDITLPALRAQPESLFVGDLGNTPHADWWSNDCFAGYFRLKSVKTSTSLQASIDHTENNSKN